MTQKSARATLVLALTAACATDDSWKHEIETRHAAMVRLVEQGRNVETLPWHAADAILLPPGGGMIRGRPAIRESMAGGAGAQIRDSVLETIALEGDGRIAYEVATYRYTLVTDEGESVRSGRFVMIWEKVDGEWLVVVDMWDADDAGS